MWLINTLGIVFPEIMISWHFTPQDMQPIIFRKDTVMQGIVCLSQRQVIVSAFTAKTSDLCELYM